jgi:hypothetical protein
MRKAKFIIAILSLIGLTAFGQTEQSNSVTGTITAVSQYNENYRLTVGDNSVILMCTRPLSKTAQTFQINQEYKDILIVKDGEYILNPKYAKQSFKISYSVNGKGWKCIQKIEPVK